MDRDDGASTPIHTPLVEAAPLSRKRSEIHPKVIYDLLSNVVPWVLPSVAP